MKHIKLITLLLFLILILILNKNIICERSIHRPIDHKIGYIKLQMSGEKKAYYLQDSHLREFPLFKTYNHDYFISRTIKDDKIYFAKNPNKYLSKYDLDILIDKLLLEIQQNKKQFSDFIILKQRDYNKFNHCGLIVLKFKNYPFVFKIFTETAKSLSRPYSKAFQERGVFILGGAFRHIMGYTRIRNIDLIQEKIKDSAEWAHSVKIPRKWFWLPKNIKWINITGYNLGNKKEQKISIPAVYGIICDEIVTEKNTAHFRNKYLRLCTFLEYTLDANPNNYKVDKNNNLILIDTEHFATLTGIREKLKPIKKHISWYIKISTKYLKEKFFSPKYYRKLRQYNNTTAHPLFNE